MSSNLPPARHLVTGLHWLRTELDQNLLLARQAIEQHAESPRDASLLDKALAQLMEARGVVILIRAYGLALLIEEMRQTTQDFAAGRVREPQPAYAALLGACVQASDYLDVLAGGQDDCALVLQPIINELRLARGKSLLTEEDLFVSQFSAWGLCLPLPELSKPGVDARAEAARLSPLFANALLAWFKSQEPAQSLARIGRIAELLAEASREPALHQLWRILAASVEALLSRGLEPGLELKRQFGRAGQLMKLIAESGELAAAGQLSDVALRLLFYVGRSRAAGPRVSSLREGLQLATWLPTSEAVQARRARLRGPGTSLLLRVAEEVRSDLAEVKDSIDLALRAGASPQDYEETCKRLQQVADTLQILGLGEQSLTLAEPLETLREAGGPEPASHEAWMEFATAVLKVELSLDEALYRQLRAGPVTEASVPAIPASAADLRDGTRALLRESLVNLSRVKGHVEAYVKSGVESGLPEAARQLAELAAVLRILDRDRVAAMVGTVAAALQSAAFARVRESRVAAERYADALAAIEYCLELQRDELPAATAALEDLSRRVDLLQAPLPVAEPEISFAAPDLELIPVGRDARPAGVDEAAPAPLVAPPPPVPQAPPEPSQPAMEAPPGTAEADVDPEIREVFLGEAAEVMESLQRVLPRWLRQPEEWERLVEIRRAFHTLKGSGRMVGASAIGEFAFAVENLLNRCLDRAVEISAPVIELVREAVAVMPGLVEAFRVSVPPPESATRLAGTARQLASGRSAADSREVLQTFRKDARVQLQAVAQWVAEQDRGAWDFAVSEPVLRSFHTLRGSAFAAGAGAIGELAGSLESYLDMLRQSQLPLPPAGLGLIDDAVRCLSAWVERVGAAGGDAIDVQPWLARIEAIRSGLAELPGAPSEQDRQLSEVFAFEALDLVQKLDAEVSTWAQAPAAGAHLRALRATGHALKGAAAMAQCAPIVATVQALDERLAAMEAGPAPGPDFFAGLRPVVEALYQMLDAYRDGSLRGDGAEWVHRVQALSTAAAATAPEAAPLPSAPAAQDPELLEVFLQEGDELLDEIERHAHAVADDPRQTAALGQWLRALHTLKGSARLAGMLGIGELAHRLESITEQVVRGDADGLPQFQARLRIAVDGLQVLLDAARHGSAGDAGAILAQIDAVPGAEPEAPAADAIAGPEEIEIPPVETEIEGLPAEMLTGSAAEETAGAISGAPSIADWISGQASPPADGFSGEERMAEASSAPAPESAPQADVSAEAKPESGPEFPPLQVPAAPPAAAPDIEFDPELAAIFSAEAAELLETMAQALMSWRLDPSDPHPAQELQRALHTLKGGARVAGVGTMGEAAHALESQVAHLQHTHAVPDASALQALALGLEGLQRQHEQIDRGQVTAPVAALADIATTEPLPAAVGPVGVAELEPAQAPAPAVAGAGWNPELFWRPESEDAAAAALRRETARVPVDRLDAMLNQAGEIAIYRSRLEENHATLNHSLNEMAQTVSRVREQLRLMDIETEAQIAARGFAHPDGAEQGHRYDTEFDALEMDRYSRMQELSRALAESLSDLSSLHAALDTASSEAESLLQQQGRINNEVQQGLMGTLMVPFSRQVQRLARVVRQTAEQNGKRARAEFSGTESEMDRNVLERMSAPLEHLLRNSVVHGIEDPAARAATGKDPEGLVHVSLKREGSQLLIEVRDDGRGLDYSAIRAQAVKRGLIRSDVRVSETDLARYIFTPGFSTARTLTQDAGRGIGMDVVSSEVKQLGGSVELTSEAGRGTRFRIRLPLMLAVSQALVVQLGEEVFAAPLTAVEGIARVPRESLAAMLAGESAKPLVYGGQAYHLQRLCDLLGLPADAAGTARTLPAILIRVGDALGGERRVAVLADRLIGNREIVSKAAGPILGSVPGVTGATIMADGRVMLVLDLPALIQEAARRALSAESVAEPSSSQPTTEEVRKLVMVVDDSITIRRVSERLLLRRGYRVLTAKDGLDAIAQLQVESPDAILLDIEMPRADGFEVAAFVRNTARIASTPIIMITSRSGEKHREHARRLGVDRYLIKPYQEDQLLAELKALLGSAEVVT